MKKYNTKKLYFSFAQFKEFGKKIEEAFGVSNVVDFHVYFSPAQNAGDISNIVVEIKYYKE